MTSGDGRVISYSSFDKPTTITKGGNTVQFFYGPDRKRFKRVETTIAKGTVTTVYAAGKAYELIETAQGVTAKHYIGDFAVLSQTVSTGAVSTSYLHQDHLGSVDAITNDNGDVVQRMSFDAWGKRRETNWQPMGLAAIENFNTDITTRGFTGHEQIDSVGLIHMNGRVYDAELGRFLSADPNVQALDNLQNFNRYSYVLNNPLSYTDPTGFFFAKLFKAIGKAFGKIFSAIGRAFKKLLRSPIVRAIIQIVGCATTGPAGCAAITGAITAATGGSLGDALKAAAFSYLGSQIWGGVSDILKGAADVAKVLVHGVVNGAMAVAQGGNFAVGFLTGAIGKIGGLVSTNIFGPAGRQAGLLGRTFMAAAAGCAGAVIAGGKCANGAVTAAFAHLFNAEGLGKKMSLTELREAQLKAVIESGAFNMKGVKFVKYVPNLKDTGNASEFGEVWIGPAAFEGSTGWFLASVAHEIEVHVQRQAMPSRPAGTPNRWWLGEGHSIQGELMMEVEAYQYMIDNKSAFQYNKQEEFFIKAQHRIHYDQLNDANKNRVNNNDFSSYTK